MNVKLGQAVKMFFGNSSLEMVYFEALANALDANATAINIEISASAFNQPETLEIKISDNGIGFTDEKYRTFSNLFDVEENSHKGLGRLVYLCYFSKTKIISNYNRTYKREFNFTEAFKEEDAITSNVQDTTSGTTLHMSGYTLTKVKQHTYLQPSALKKRILDEFYSRLYQLKLTGKEIIINIKANIENTVQNEVLTNNEIPELEKEELESSINLIDKFYLYYFINKVDPLDTSFIAAISVDNRTMKVDIIDEENIPPGYNMVFLLYSDWFTGKVDSSRQNLAITEQERQSIQTIFRKKVSALIEKNIPLITNRNTETKKNLINRYPHLSGYFSSEDIGYISRSEVIKKAQDQFFKAQKELLDASSLSEEQYEKSIELSVRALTEYILFRQLTIEKLKGSTQEDCEAELHKLFATMKVKFEKENIANDLYRNNAWLLDDKYMTYEAVLSDKEMGDLITLLTNEETERDGERPDLALVFSQNPIVGSPFDVVIVELKKRGLTLEENWKVITQLEKRARKLMSFYHNQIQRIWYYGIIEFNEEIELALAGEYTELYSSGKMYYRETEVAISLSPKINLPIGVFIWDINAVVNDADARNSTFLQLIKSKFQNS